MVTTAIVTGGASGIGRALGAGLVRRGVEVVLADIDGPGAKESASSMTGPGTARGVELDVRDADAVDELVAEVHEDRDGLDLLFNNAGIGVGGETHELTLAHWERAIDVNVRGVIHGIHAAYPLMRERGRGHIVNTASLAGLTAAPMLAPYAATKHAVVGLSMSLRLEAAPAGVRVSVVCPGVIETPILDSTGPEDLPKPPTARFGARELLVRAAGRPYPPEDLAEDVLRAVARNRALIVAPRRARFTWYLARLVPGAVERGNRQLLAGWRRELEDRLEAASPRRD